MLSLIFIFSNIVTCYALEPQANTDTTLSNATKIDILDVVNNPEKYPDIKITIHKTADEFIERLSKDSNISKEDKNIIIENVRAKQNSRSTTSYTGYVTVSDYCSVTSSYVVRPYFYCEVSASDANLYNITSFNRILNAALDRNCNGVVKEFGGTLYFNLESYNTIYWDLNGTFYETGTTTWELNSSAGMVGFNVGGASNYYRYCQHDDRLIFNI